MRGRLLLLALLLAFPLPLVAQERPGITPTVGASVGTTRLPEPLVESCGTGGRAVYPALAAQAGLARGSWAAVLHGSGFGATAIADCITVPPVPPNGVARYRSYSAARGHGDVALSLQMRYAPVSSFWSAGVGAGRLFEAKSPYALARVGLHTRGRVRVGVEAEHWTVRLGYEDVEQERAGGEIVRHASLGSGHEWHSALALRLGVEVR